MGLFKNEVGRPSNETIKKRNIFKGICVLLVIVIIGLVCYILNDKGVINLNNTNKNTKGGNEKVVTTTTKQVKEVEEEKVDSTKLTTKKVGVSEFGDIDIFDVYYNDKKVISSSEGRYEILKVSKINEFNNYLVFNIEYNDNTGGCALIIIDINGNVVGSYDGTFDYKYKNLTGKIYRGEYNIENNNIYINTDDDGQDAATSCERYAKNDPSAYIDVISYSNGKFSSPKLYRSIGAKEVIKDYNRACN